MNLMKNLWRQETPGAEGWERSVRPGSINKHVMISADTHINEPNDLWLKHLPEHLSANLPRVEVDADGKKWQVVPGWKKTRLAFHEDEGDEEDQERTKAAKSPEEVVAHMDRDGIDINIAFANKGLMTFAMPDHETMVLMCQIFNDWAVDTYSGVKDRVVPVAMIPTFTPEVAVAELDRIAKKDFFRVAMLPTKPIYGPSDPSHINYNLPEFDPLWARLQDMDMAATFHVSTGMNPRTARGNGGAIINYAAHSVTTTVEPVASLCASGVIEQFKKLRFATIEAGIGWVPWLLEAMDEAYRKHYLWTRPVLKRPPSEYYLENGFSSFGEDPYGLALVKSGPFENNFMWANDYPHHEGTWPHSAAAIERQMGDLTDGQRAKILGENAIRCFRLQDLVAKRLAAKAA